MKLKRKVAIIGLFFTMLLMNGCGIFSGEEELSAQDQANTSVAQTLEVMHGVETVVAMTLAAERTKQATEVASEVTPTDTPVAPPTEVQPDTPTPTISFTATLSVPMVSVSVNTNCRTGPGTVYDLISALLIGKQAEVVARSADGAYWVIRNPGGSGTCWLWGFYATVVGPTGSLPVWDPPATPTPQATNTLTPMPTTYNTGALIILQNFTADLDEGVVMGGTLHDIWYQIESDTARFINPRNGARISIWGSSAPGMYDCIGAPLSTTRIAISTASVGTYVCYQTAEGRPGVFRINELTSDALSILTIGFTTWNAP